MEHLANWINTLFFGIYPYIAFAVFAVGCLIRFDREQYSWKASSSQLLDKSSLRLGSNLFHIGVLFIIVGHLVGLLTPTSIYTKFITVPQKQLLAMVAGGIFGVLCFTGLLLLITRRLNNPRLREHTRFSDWLVLWMLFIQVSLGLSTLFVSAQHLDGGSMLNLSHWAQHIVTFQPNAADFIKDEHWLFKVHIWLGLSLFVVAPFSRLVHVLSAPIWYVFRPYQVVRSRWTR
ncbi:MAG: respiratory nitrate reductase subunit gamma [Moraxellaceae bacterium]|nr:respiratory nitrate reductase subunit gamma [Moraxellaceae bacterium]MCP5177178.1 respiratory nitrate reductase subunit gamma [Moraxellaceae bacterium]